MSSLKAKKGNANTKAMQAVLQDDEGRFSARIDSKLFWSLKEMLAKKEALLKKRVTVRSWIEEKIREDLDISQ